VGVTQAHTTMAPLHTKAPLAHRAIASQARMQRAAHTQPRQRQAEAHAREQQRTGLKKNSFSFQLFFFFPQPRMLEPADLGSIFARA